jgi:hypothetical protein
MLRTSGTGEMEIVYRCILFCAQFIQCAVTSLEITGLRMATSEVAKSQLE